MPRKPKFRPKITRVKLNPEQAVLLCNCYNSGYGSPISPAIGTVTLCSMPFPPFQPTKQVKPVSGVCSSTPGAVSS